jgi:ADP-ribose pyrophosphatase YjhB (NUDIX family)
MADDDVIAMTKDGRKLYDNAVSVAVAVITVRDGAESKVVTIRRGNEPGRGLIALPGGFQMRGETFLDAASRELKEETGIDIEPYDLTFCWIRSGTGNINLLFVTNRNKIKAEDLTLVPEQDEVQEVILMDRHEIMKSEWAFPTHEEAARFFS